ncbi:MAG: hypothetical protein LBH46_02805 [Rickettsiales bacterium]|jgi:hypothetical protein|nr:hypothetical protein [Rickettsiales bacterium]
MNEYQRQSEKYFAPQHVINNNPNPVGAVVKNGVQDISNMILDVVSRDQRLKLEQDSISQQVKMQQELEKVRLANKDNPNTEQYYQQAERVYTSNMDELRTKTGWTQKQTLNDQILIEKEKFKAEQTLWAIQTERKNLLINYNNQKQQLQDQAFLFGTEGDKAGFYNIETIFTDYIDSNLNELFSENERNLEKQNLNQNLMISFASGFIENNPKEASVFIEKNKKIFGAEKYKFLRDFAAKRETTYYEWQQGKEKIAGDTEYINSLNKIYDGEMSKQDVFNYLELNKNLPQEKKQFLIDAAIGIDKAKKKEQKEKEKQEKESIFNDLNDKKIELFKIGKGDGDIPFDFKRADELQKEIIKARQDEKITKSEFKDLTGDLMQFMNIAYDVRDSKEYSYKGNIIGDLVYGKVSLNNIQKEALNSIFDDTYMQGKDGEGKRDEYDKIKLDYIFNTRTPQKVNDIINEGFNNQKAYQDIDSYKNSLSRGQFDNIYRDAVRRVQTDYVVENGGENLLKTLSVEDAVKKTNELIQYRFMENKLQKDFDKIRKEQKKNNPLNLYL